MNGRFSSARSAIARINYAALLDSAGTDDETTIDQAEHQADHVPHEHHAAAHGADSADREARA